VNGEKFCSFVRKFQFNRHRKIIHRTIIQIPRFQVTDYLLKHFLSDQSLIEHHLDLLEKQPNENFKQIFRKYFHHSCHITNLITFRMLSFLSEDNRTMECISNEENHWKYRAMAIRLLENSNNFHHQFEKIFQNENESTPIRILAFQILSPFFNSSQIETIQSIQLRYYLQSLSKQSSIWLGHSGSYKFPFGLINIIFNEKSSSILPNIVQLKLANHLEIDIYWNSVRKDEI
jgi:hypothetical protein